MSQNVKIWSIGLLGKIETQHIRFSTRRTHNKKRAWMIGVVMSFEGVVILSTEIKNNDRVAAISACINQYVKCDMFDGAIDVSSNIEDLQLDHLSEDARKYVTILTDEDRTIFPANSLTDILDILSDQTDNLSQDEIRINLWHKVKRGDPSLTFRPIKDDLCVKHEADVDDVLEYRCKGPETAIIGLAGSGKSSLISGLLGLSGEDLPPAGVSRTTLCPISFCNEPDLPNFKIRIILKDDAEIVRMLADRVNDAMIFAFERNIASHECFLEKSPEAALLLSSPDTRFDLQMLFGKHTSEKGGVWQEVIMNLRFALDALKDCGVTQLEIGALDVGLPMAQRLMEGIREKMSQLPFGKLTRTSKNMIFTYATVNRQAAIEAGRRFYGVSKRYSGKSFGPICEKIEIIGQWVQSPDAFVITDSRGFDHEGGTQDIADGSLFNQISCVDRVVIVESSEKAGDIKTMGLVARIIANGEAEKVYFAATKTDLLLEKGVNATSHIAKGIRNGLNTLDEDVGRDAVQTVRDTLEATPVFEFGSLHNAHELGSSGLLASQIDDELGLDNASEASKFFRTFSIPVGQKHELDLDNFSPIYLKKSLAKSLSSLFSGFYQDIENAYGSRGENKGSLHWGTIKSELRRAVSRYETLGQESMSPDDLFMMRLLDDQLAKVISLFIDRPYRWSGFADSPTKSRIRDMFRRDLQPLFASLVIRHVFVENFEKWVEARNLSMASYGPKSTYARCEIIHDIVDELEFGIQNFQSPVAERMIGLGAQFK